MLLSECKLASLNRTTNRLVYSRANQERHAEIEIRGVDEFALDTVGHPFPNLY